VLQKHFGLLWSGIYYSNKLLYNTGL